MNTRGIDHLAVVTDDMPAAIADFVLVGLLIAFPSLALWLPGVLKV